MADLTAEERYRLFGEGENPNYITTDDLARFQSKTGRAATDWERQWVQQVASAYGSAKKALEFQADRIAGVSQKVQQQAKALGYEIAPEEANSIRDQFMPTTGSASDSEIANALNLSATSLGTRQNKDLEKKIEDILNPPEATITDEHKGTASRLIKETFGREASQDEIDFFSKEIAGGQSPYEIGLALKNDPEYLKIQSDAEAAKYKTEAGAAREQLNTELLRGEDEAYSRMAPETIAAFQNAGQIGSSGLANALAQSRKELESQRQSYLGGLAYEDAVRGSGYNREDFLARNAQTYNQYLRQNEADYQQKLNLQNIGNQYAYDLPLQQLNRVYGLQDAATQRAWDMEDYSRQQSDWFRALGEQRKSSRQNALYGLAGSLLGAAVQGGMMSLGRGGGGYAAYA